MKQVTWVQLLTEFTENIKKYSDQQKPSSSANDLKVELQILRIGCENISNPGYQSSLIQLNKIFDKEGITTKDIR
jgi:hypothetical protein